jgi:lipoprotein-releasing system permease protein
LISIVGIAIGVTALIVVLSVMDGMHEDLRNKILGTNSHIILLNSLGDIRKYKEVEEKIKNVSGIITTSPFIFNHAMLNSGRGVSGVVVRGIFPDSESKVTDLKTHLIEGDLSSLMTSSEDKSEGIVIGKDLAEILGLFLGDNVDIISPFGRVTPAGTVPKVKTFKVTGIFKTGMYEYDSSLALISIPVAQSFFSMGDAVTGIEIKVKDIYATPEIAAEIDKIVGPPYWTKDWIEMNRNLFSALKLEKFAMFIILTLIILVAAFNIISTLIMMVMEKGRDIAILKSMGASRGGIMKIFMMEGIIIGVIGTLLGCMGGYVLCQLLDTYEFIKLPPDIYQVSTLPVKMSPMDFLTVSFFSILISFLATLYPSWNAGRLDPVEALRYE